MSNRTCGECRFFESKEFICCHSGDEVEAHFIACFEFEPMPEQKPTNHERLAEDSGYMAEVVLEAHESVCPFCAYLNNEKCTVPKDISCFHGVVKWLNAPAESKESEGEDE